MPRLTALHSLCRFLLLFHVLCLALTGGSCPALAGNNLQLSAGVGMRSVLEELLRQYPVNNTAIRTNFASSGVLARQVLQGAPVDLFISANMDWMEQLRLHNRITEPVVLFAANSLVVVGRRDTPLHSLDELRSCRRIAIGNPRSVPAGQYAEQALRNAGLLTELQPRLLLTSDVRQALLYADRGEVDAALVYHSDACLARQARLLLRVPPQLHDPIRFPMALTSRGADNPAARQLLAFLTSPSARALLVQRGFIDPLSLPGSQP
ncbi:molybdate ABC transporter substrate-binding protein [Desulfuromonas thiophila]|uniref:molybdate ABC transporter substrate-binding protein n=1 Tax=Desulfuromonas thiophila TaxID=57664 RepID=UPI0024A9461E|nr:molybdate ABC transporter substrate-binding protein [Desulfuromonas thiophila]